MLEIGTMLSGRYEVLKRVGSGGMADVYMAKEYIPIISEAAR